MSFLTAHLGYEIPSPAILEKIGTAFRRAVPRTTGSSARDTTRVRSSRHHTSGTDAGPASVVQWVLSGGPYTV